MKIYHVVLSNIQYRKELSMSGKKRGILFDFDDTLVQTTVYFERARERFAQFMVKLGFPLDEVLAVLDRLDIENVNRYGGFAKECFPHAMAQTYEYFCGMAGVKTDKNISQRVESIGWWVFEQPPVLLSGVVETLEELSSFFPLYLATKGDPTVQMKRIGESGLSKYFTGVHVLTHKNTDDYKKIAVQHQLDVNVSWVVGNSIKSDINPALKAGYNCIFIPHQYTWHHEMEEPLGGHYTVNAITEIPGVIMGTAVAI